MVAAPIFGGLTAQVDWLGLRVGDHRALSRDSSNEPGELSQILLCYLCPSWWRGSVVERRSLAGELSLSCARPAADG